MRRLHEPRDPGYVSCPRCSDAARAFSTVGYAIVRQRGSHIRLRDETGVRLPLTRPQSQGTEVGAEAREVEEVLARPAEDRPGREGSRVALGRTEALRQPEQNPGSRRCIP
jgi:hypothetical protein